MGTGPLFGILVQERPAAAADWWSDVFTWLQDAGGFAALALAIWLLAAAVKSMSRSAAPRDPNSQPVRLTFPVLVLAALALVAYLLGGFLSLGSEQPGDRLGRIAAICYTVGGALALAGLALPFVSDLPRLRWRRIWALTRLSFQEAIRRRILWVFLVFLIVVLFPPKWFLQIKPEDEIRNNVSVLYWAMTPLLLVVASLLAAFSIPTDIRNQTIHTVVTKPVERFELVLGRFFGYLGLATVALLVLTTLSLALIAITNFSKEAREESFKARQAVYGDLGFYALNSPEFQGESVGREWEYRRYIAGGADSRQRAVWTFTDLSDVRADGRVSVPCEFQFDIFRTTKGEEGKGVFVTFKFFTPDWKDLSEPGAPSPHEKEYAEDARRVNTNAQPDGSPGGGDAWKAVNELAGKYGYYEFANKEVSDYHTLAVQVPPALFKKAQEAKPRMVEGPGGKRPLPRLMAEVKCESRTQFLGVARYDMYLLADEGNFFLNFYKGAFGLWLRLALVVGIAVTCSTYLSGVISWLVTLFLFGLGFAQDFIAELASGKSVGGGPFESLVRLARVENLTSPLDTTPGTRVAIFGDQFFQWGLKRVLNIIPDVDRLDWSNHVAEGFNVYLWRDSAGAPGLLMNALFVAGYLLPWALLAYYLIKTREVAA